MQNLSRLLKGKVSLLLIAVLALSGSSCNLFGSLSPARDVSGVWSGYLTSSENNVAQTDMQTGDLVLQFEQVDNTVSGVMIVYFAKGTYAGELTGTINGAYIDFTCIIGNGCIQMHGSFTSDNMEGMRGSNPPPYITCGDVLNDGHGSKGIEWKVQRED